MPAPKPCRKSPIRRIFLLGSCLILFGQPGGAAGSPLVDPDQYSGKVVLLDFWASWCVPCRHSFPWMQQMQEKYGEEGLVVVAVNLDNDVMAAKKFLAEHPVEFDVVYDPDRKLARRYGIEAMPSSIIFGRDGELVSRHRGFKVRKRARYEENIVAALEATDQVAEN